LNQLVDFYKIHKEVHAIEGDLDAVLFNPVPSTIPNHSKMAEVQTSEMDAKLAPVNMGQLSFVY
jgi:hypothetical protein